MSLRDDYKKAVREELPLGKAEQWFVDLPEEDRAFILEKISDSLGTGWKASMYRAAKGNGLDCGLTTFKELLSNLERYPTYLDDHVVERTSYYRNW